MAPSSQNFILICIFAVALQFIGLNSKKILSFTSTNNTDRHNITQVLLIVALNTITLIRMIPGTPGTPISSTNKMISTI